MGIKTKLTTKGMEKALEALAASGRNIDEIVKRALPAGGQVFVDGMRSRAPEDTGNLKSKIKMSEPEQDGNYIWIEVGLVDADDETARYGNAQEYGWSDRQGAKAGHPYIRPTVDHDKSRARKAMIEVVKQEEIV